MEQIPDAKSANYDTPQTMRSALIVSPYIDASTFPLRRVVRKAAGVRGKLRVLAALARPDRSLIFDSLTNCLVTVRPTDIAFLKTLADRPFTQRDLSPGDAKRIQRLMQAGLVLDEEEAFRAHNYEHVSIEVNSHCNYRCSFCPVSTDPLPKKIMPLALYQHVLDSLADADVPGISLNHYGEPTLDPHLVRRVQIAKDAGLAVILYTNASQFDDETLRSLASSGNVSLVVNLPSVDPDSFHEVTGWKLLDRVLDNLRLAKTLGMSVKISVNAPKHVMTRPQRNALRRQIRQRTGIRATLNHVLTRAGSMTDETYALPVAHAGRLNGCYRMLTKMSIGVDGTAFLCCHDFKQKYVLGNLSETGLKEIAESDRAVQLRRWAFGADTPPDGFICQSCEETCSGEGDEKALTIGDHSWPGNFWGSIETRSAIRA